MKSSILSYLHFPFDTESPFSCVFLPGWLTNRNAYPEDETNIDEAPEYEAADDTALRMSYKQVLYSTAPAS